MSIDAIPYVNLAAQWHEERSELLPVIEKILESGQYVGGEEVDLFEKEVSAKFKVKHAIAVNSGTDALFLGLMALGIKSGDEVITPPNSFVASTAVVVNAGAIPVFVDVKEDQNIDPKLIEKSITANTKAIIAVHLTGRMCDMEAICHIASQHNLAVVEDAAQSAGSKFMNRHSGSWGDIGCFSAHPLKNLAACGDAGFVTTNNDEIAKKIQLLRNHGLATRDRMDQYGYVSRMDALQAAILRYRLRRLPSIIERRRTHASLYRSLLNMDKLFQPEDLITEFNTFHTFVIQLDKREQLRQFLIERRIETAVHYPLPIHLQPACRPLGYESNSFPVAELQAKKILTLPVHQNLTAEQITRVADSVNEFVCG